MDLERQREHFKSISERDREARSHGNHKHLKHLIWEAFLEGKPELDRPGLRVLEAMCGYAEGHDILETHLGVELDYEGFDYSDSVVDYMREHRPELHISHHDVTQFTSAKRYDLIVVLGGLHHVPNHCDQALERLYEALEPGGYMINLEPTHGLWLTRTVRELIYAKNSLFDELTERAFDVDEYEATFERHGFELADAMYPGLLSYVLYYNPDAFPLLNLGDASTVDTVFNLERPLLRTPLARACSFATLALWRKPQHR